MHAVAVASSKALHAGPVPIDNCAAPAAVDLVSAALPLAARPAVAGVLQQQRSSAGWGPGVSNFTVAKCKEVDRTAPRLAQPQGMARSQGGQCQPAPSFGRMLPATQGEKEGRSAHLTACEQCLKSQHKAARAQP